MEHEKLETKNKTKNVYSVIEIRGLFVLAVSLL